MAEFIFDKEIFQRKFVQNNGEVIRNRAKSVVPGCDSICPNNTDSGNKYAGYKSRELLADTLHYLFEAVINEKKAEKVDIICELEKQVDFENENLVSVFKDIMTSFYFDENKDSNGSSIALLRYQPASSQKDFGKFVYDVLLDKETKDKFRQTLEEDTNLLDKIVNSAYESLNVLQNLSTAQEYSQVFRTELGELLKIANIDFRKALDGHTDVLNHLEFLIAYYVFIYLSQFALRLDNDLLGKKVDPEKVYPRFKAEKEAVSEDRDCVSQGWRKVDKKTRKLFKHMIVLNMLNCHTNDTPYYSYSDLYRIYENNEDEREKIENAIDYILDEYTVKHTHDTNVPGQNVDFTEVELKNSQDVVEQFRFKVQYLYDCVSHELESKGYRQNVVSYVAGNYNHVLKMRFVKSWGQLGNMMIISNEDLILMIQICQMSSERMNPERGIQISDLFDEFKKRGLYMDGKTKQYVIDYLISINLIDSKCDSEEAQYVKRIQ